VTPLTLPNLSRLARLALAFSAIACGAVTGEQPEALTDPGPRDASDDRALAFDGVDDYVSVGTARSPQIMRDQSLMLWFRPEGAASGASDDLQVLFTLRRSERSGIVLALDHDMPLVYSVFGRRDSTRSTSALKPGEWHHLAYVTSVSSATLYLDGAVTATGDEPGTNRTPIQAFVGSFDGYRDMFHGAIDELRVYDRTLTAEEVAAIAAGVRPDDAENLVIYLPFDEAEGARSYDRSGLGNHAELGDGVTELMPERIVADLP
jgi:hypothetical protein